MLPEEFHIIGITRQSHIEHIEILGDLCTIFPMDLTSLKEYERLAQEIQSIEKRFGTPAQHLLYLSVPSAVSGDIIGMFGTSGIAALPQTKLLLEKPFGNDLISARALIAHIHRYFAKDAVYRIDHYLLKSVVGELIALNRTDGIAQVAILASEAIGIEGRAGFYEETGALRDMVQSHLLQFAAVALGGSDDMGKSSDRRYAALKQLTVVVSASFRGQYEGYRDEVGNPDSTVETFVSLTLQSSDPKYANVPITITTGKKLDTKNTEIRISYRDGSDDLVLTDQSTANAYEQVLEYAIHGDKRLFISDEEVLECWRIIDPVQQAWSQSPHSLYRYAEGSTARDIGEKLSSKNV
jgi:glucose-6-phosphate 1-dehydrogenase